MKRRNKKKKPQKRNTVEVFELTEKGNQLMNLIQSANLQDDTLSILAHGLWVWIWCLTKSTIDPVTVECVYENQSEPKEDLEQALKELENRGHICIDQNRIITLNP